MIFTLHILKLFNESNYYLYKIEQSPVYLFRQARWEDRHGRRVGVFPPPPVLAPLRVVDSQYHTATLQYEYRCTTVNNYRILAVRITGCAK